jgi:hypothetical protein
VKQSARALDMDIFVRFAIRRALNADSSADMFEVIMMTLHCVKCDNAP